MKEGGFSLFYTFQDPNIGGFSLFYTSQDPKVEGVLACFTPLRTLRWEGDYLVYPTLVPLPPWYWVCTPLYTTPYTLPGTPLNTPWVAIPATGDPLRAGLPR